MTGEQLKFYNFVLPDIHVSKFLCIPAHMARIYFIDDWDVGYTPLSDEPSENYCADPLSEMVPNDDESVDPSDYLSLDVKQEMKSESEDPVLGTEDEGSITKEQPKSRMLRSYFPVTIGHLMI